MTDTARLAQLASLLAVAADRATVFDWPAVEAATERLAALLLRRVGADRLRAMRPWPVPRGGLIVAGMLAYLADLPARRFTAGDGVPLVIDDVALTGWRLARTLDRLDTDGVVVALVAAPAGLVAAAEADPRVEACVAAVTLGDATDRLDADTVAELREVWAGRLDGRMWTGVADPVAFPWSEPAHLLWDAERGRVEEGWRLVSPERSLAARGRLGPPGLDRTRRRFRFPDRLAYGWFDEGLVVCPLDGGQVARLEGSAAAMWGTVGTLGDVDAAVEALSARFAADPATIRADLEETVATLVAAGLLVEVGT